MLTTLEFTVIINILGKNAKVAGRQMKDSKSDVNRGWTIKWELLTEWASQPDK